MTYHAIPACGFRGKRRIGLLGGSFNPPHAGHVAISKEVQKRLQLDGVWWLVTPGNPLKDNSKLPPVSTRLAQCRALLSHPRIHATDIEQRLHTIYAVDTVKALKRRYPHITFVWIIGSDNWFQLPKWNEWRALIESVPIVVYPRDPFTYKALAGKAAIAYKRRRLNVCMPKKLSHVAPPAWNVLWLAKHPLSSTALRDSLNT